MASRSAHNAPSASCIVGSGTRVCGTLSGQEDVVIMGRLEGSVSLQAALTVAQDGELEANLDVESAVIAGQVVGDIAARHRLVLERGARVEGKVSSPSLVIAEGAEIFGHVDMDVDLPEGLLASAHG